MAVAGWAWRGGAAAWAVHVAEGAARALGVGSAGSAAQQAGVAAAGALPYCARVLQGGEAAPGVPLPLRVGALFCGLLRVLATRAGAQDTCGAGGERVGREEGGAVVGALASALVRGMAACRVGGGGEAAAHAERQCVEAAGALQNVSRSKYGLRAVLDQRLVGVCVEALQAAAAGAGAGAGAGAAAAAAGAPTPSAVCAALCRTLTRLASPPKEEVGVRGAKRAREALTAAGALATLVALLDARVHDSEVCPEAALALLAVVYGDSAALRTCREEGVLIVLAAAVEEHPNAQMLTWAAGLLKEAVEEQELQDQADEALEEERKQLRGGRTVLLYCVGVGAAYLAVVALRKHWQQRQQAAAAAAAGAGAVQRGRAAAAAASQALARLPSAVAARWQELVGLWRGSSKG